MSLPSSESKVEINFEGLNSGVYILRVADSSSVYSERVVRR